MNIKLNRLCRCIESYKNDDGNRMCCIFTVVKMNDIDAQKLEIAQRHEKI